MKNQVTFGHVLTVLAILVIPLIVWGVNVEKRFQQHSDNIINVGIRVDHSDKRSDDLTNKFDAKLDKISDKLGSILVELQNKKNRDDN